MMLKSTNMDAVYMHFFSFPGGLRTHDTWDILVSGLARPGMIAGQALLAKP
jgi:hypothetical protein